MLCNITNLKLILFEMEISNPHRSGLIWSTIFLICGSKPISNILSASSSTRYVHLFKFVFPASRKSNIRPKKEIWSFQKMNFYFFCSDCFDLQWYLLWSSNLEPVIYFCKAEDFLNLAHDFLIVLVQKIPYIFTADLSFLIWWPISST